MTSSREDHIDPFFVLDIPHQAFSEEIEKAWLMKMKSGKETELYVKAYGMIKDEIGRNQMKWDEMFTYLEPLPKIEIEIAIEVHELVEELAFLSPWELGDEACQN